MAAEIEAVVEVPATGQASPPLRVAHIITTGDRGGAEMMLWRLLRELRGEPVEFAVVTLKGDGPVGQQIEALGVPVFRLGMRHMCPRFGALGRLSSWLRHWQPDVLQGWMYHGNLAATLAGPFLGRPDVLWGLHHSGTNDLRWPTRAVVGLCARLSRRGTSPIVCCAEATREAHLRAGYRPDGMLVIPNGWDTTEWQPRPELRARYRAQLGIAPEALVVGTVGRFDPVKDYRNLLGAVAQLKAKVPGLRLVLCGAGLDAANETLAQWLAEFGLTESAVLVGASGEVPGLLNALDVFCLSSRTEAMPLVVGEAMACGLPCVVTDVGDAAHLVGHTGLAVPPQDADALAKGLATMLTRPAWSRAALGVAARERITAHYSLPLVARQYLELWQECCDARHAKLGQPAGGNTRA